VSRADDRAIHWYRSKIDWWLVPLLALPPIAAVVVSIAAWQAEDHSELIWAVGAIVLVAAFYFGLVFPIRYGIGADGLIVRFGLCRQNIAFSRITEVSPTRNPLSSPALSLDRLKIQFGQGLLQSVMISPSPREQFLEDLASHAGLTRRGDRLDRTAL